MFRAIDSKVQADLIDGYVVEQGGRPKRTKTMEVVARINGAPNWNAMQQQKNRNVPERKSALVEALVPADLPVDTLVALAASLDDPVLSLILADVPEGASKEGLLVAAQSKLETLLPSLERLQHYVATARGLNRVAREVATSCRILLSTQMYSEEESWVLRLPRTNVADEFRHFNLPEELFVEVRKKGIVIEAEVQYPRSDRFGVPAEATSEGFTQFIWEEGFRIAKTLEVFGEDSGDDTPMSCIINVAIPEDVYAQVAALLR
jgi:hypothetical protein